LRNTHAALGDLRRAQGRIGDAHESWREALQILSATAAGLADHTLRDTLNASPAARRLRELVSAAPQADDRRKPVNRSGEVSG
jgi:hypothetical protein